MVKVGIAAAYMTKFGEHWQRSLKDLAAESIVELLEGTEIAVPGKIGAVIVGNMASGQLIGQEHLGSLVVDHGGLSPVAGMKVEAAGASGALAIRTAYLYIKSGLYDVVLVVGVEKMTDQTRSAKITSVLSSAGDQEWELQTGLTFVGSYALMAKAHFAKYGTNKRHIAAVSAKNHANAVYNAKAQFRRAFEIDQIVNAAMVSEPLGLLDCSPASDGAAAVLLCSEDAIKEITDAPVWITGSGHASDSLSLVQRDNLHSMKATRLAAKQAYEQAGVEPDQIKVAEMHDNFSITEIIGIEDLGFFLPGKGGPATLDGETKIGGTVSTNPSGGLKALGHPLGATGVAQAVEIFKQLRNEVEPQRQVDSEVGLTHSIGGTGSTAIVHIYRR
ncbi:MAG: thiolase domain-containing protein [Candidatus Hodarchaeales archaeon]|jgi:acetyl-CoA C-acetyltransferase